MTTALITGAVGQDGAYLARHLRSQGYRVIGTMPPIEPPAGFVEAYLEGVDLRVVDLVDESAMRALLESERPDEIYNLASISSVAASWQAPVEVARVNGIAFLGAPGDRAWVARLGWLRPSGAAGVVGGDLRHARGPAAG